MNHWTAGKANIPAAVHARLLQIAKAEGVPFNTVAIRFVSERLLYRVSRSDHAGRFVLKGAWLFYLWEMQRRTTRDVDLLGYGDNSIEQVEKAFREISQIKVAPDDGLEFDPESIEASQLQETEEYPGVRVRVTALLGNGQYRAQVDIGFGEALVEDPVEAELPVLLEFPRPRLKTALPSHVPTGLDESFARDRQQDWERFMGDSGGAAVPGDFGQVVEVIRDFVYPPLKAAADRASFSLGWEPGKGWRGATG